MADISHRLGNVGNVQRDRLKNVPRGLYRLHHSGSAHFITFTCYHRYAHLSDPSVRDLFVQALERTRKLYGMQVYGFVVMPEHIHLLISEPERGTVANAIQSLKISSAKRGKQWHAVADGGKSVLAKTLL